MVRSSRSARVADDAKRGSSPPSRSRKLAPDPEWTKAVLEILDELYPNPECALEHKNAFELLVATILSAQCTDKRVNLVTPHLFARFGDAKALALAPLPELKELIRSTGFFRNKAKNLKAMAEALIA